MRLDILSLAAVLFLILSSGCQSGSSSSSAVPPPSSLPPIVDLVCATYALGDRPTRDSSKFDAADKIKDNCTIVLTWWSLSVSETWCPYILENSDVEYCGPYDNWGFISSRNDKSKLDLGGDLYNDDILKNNPEWLLRDASGNLVFKPFLPAERVPHHGNMDFVDYYFDFFLEVPSSIAGGRWQGTYSEKSWNIRFLDNYLVYAPWVWSSIPINPDTGSTFTREEMEQNMLNATKRLRERADNEAGGLKYFANIWSDVEAEYFDREIYAELMQYLDYVLFEVWTTNPEGVPVSEEVWLKRISAAQDMIQNRRAEPVVQTELGDFWYALSSLLLVTENERGMIWSQTMFADNILRRINGLDLGEHLSAYIYIDNIYQREWEKGKVLVNPSDSLTVTISLGGDYEDVETGEIVSSVALSPKTGKILLAR